MRELTLKAHAKINLFLYILGKRPDGYHSILTLFQKISLHDKIYFQWERGRRDIRLQCEGEETPHDSSNLVYRAADAFMDMSQQAFSLKIRLLKNIPVGGGLGGGSSDAAIILKTMNSIAGAPLALDNLRKIAGQLGADVPFFFLDAPSAIGSGIGDELRPVDVPRKWYVLATPPFGVSTKWAYENSVLTSREPGTILNGSKVFATSYWHNDFEAKVFKKYPELARIKQTFIESGSEASMLSGSGSTVFGVFSSRSKAEVALDLIQKSDKNLRVFITKALS